MTIPRLQQMNEYWRNYPPIHVMIASYFGLGEKPKEVDNSPDDLSELLGNIPMG
jgi:hypothetical protein